MSFRKGNFIYASECNSIRRDARPKEVSHSSLVRKQKASKVKALD